MPAIKESRNPFRIFDRDKSITERCGSDTLIYSKLWPIIFLFSSLTDIPMNLPKGSKPGQHRDWGWLPTLIVCGISAFLYYGYLCRIVHRPAQAIAYLVPFNILLIFYLVSYGRIISNTPGHAKDIELTKGKDKLYTVLGDPVWCNICCIWKPDRTHHCRVCGTCVLKMDHHCPWVNGCVGVSNQRYYIQFLFYTTVMGIWIFTTTLAAFIQFNSLATFDAIALCVLIVGGMLTFILSIFTMSHVLLILNNRTTLENSIFQKWDRARKTGKSQDKRITMFTQTGKSVFDQGKKNNWQEVMGVRKLQWFLPFSSKQVSDGVHFGYNPDTLVEYNNDKSTRVIEEVKPNAI
ncbi:hypothetical protein HPULCUR_006435 [Helicostylum pulchrum]|uniref:Palmitoyltransferase n=1 Tax=Helicostylum pulchrum TaxID=562976 RepID=A0ABP9Y2S1_9FUNG